MERWQFLHWRRGLLGAAIGVFAAVGSVGVITAAQAPAGRSGAAASGHGVISGRVVEAATSRPIADAVVTIVGRGAPPRRVLAGRNGDFEFAGLDDGSYTVNAAEPGYFGGASGQEQPMTLGRPVDVVDGAANPSLQLRLWKFAAIAGSVHGNTGQALAGVEVRAIRRTLMGGAWRLIGGGATLTDDRGRYRIANLIPGDYVVAVRPDRDPETPLLVSMLASNPLLAADVMSAITTGGDGQPVTDARVPHYALTFYRSTRTMAAASTIALRPGDVRASVDFALEATKGVRVTGTLTSIGVAGVATLPSDSFEDVIVRLLVAGDPDNGTPLDAASTACSADGRFAFSSVTPGRYTLAVAQNAAAPAGPQDAVASGVTRYAHADVVVAARDVLGVSLPLQRSRVITGSLRFDAGEVPPAPQVWAITVRFDAIDRPPANAAAALRGAVTADGRIKTMGIPPGRYFVRVGGAPRGWTLQSATIGDRDVLDRPFDVEADRGDLLVTFSRHPLAAISGRVVAAPGSGTRKGATTVVMFPSDPALRLDSSGAARRLRLGVPSNDGTYAIGGIPPGDYCIVAVTSPVPTEWQDPKRLDVWARAATRVIVTGSEPHTVDLKAQTSAVRATDGKGRR